MTQGLVVPEMRTNEFFKSEAFATDGKGENWLTFSFASEEEVSRWYGSLILSLKRGSMKDDRVRDMAVSFLKEHNTYENLGMVRKIYTKNRVAFADVEFNEREESQMVRDEMLKGTRPNVSPLAVPTDDEAIEVVEDNGFWDYRLRYNSWQPFEISSVSMPANPKVGYGTGKLTSSSPQMDQNIEAMVDVARRRFWNMSTQKDLLSQSATPGGGEPLNAAGGVGTVDATQLSDEEKAAFNEWMKEKAEKEKAEKDKADALVAQQQSQQAPQGHQPIIIHNPSNPQLDQFLGEERKKAQAATEQAETLRLGIEYGQAELAMEHLKAGGSAQDFREKLRGVTMNPHMRTGTPQNKGGGAEAFSLSKLIRAKAFPMNTEYQRDAEYELGCGSHLSNQASEGGIMVPFTSYAKGGPMLDVRSMYHITNRNQRAEPFAVTAAAGDSASNAIVTMVDLDRVVDFLVEDSDILMKCDVAMGLTGNVQVPIELTGATLGFNAETAIQAESTPTFGNVQITPHILSAHVQISKQAIVQTAGWIERRIRMMLARQFRSQISYYILAGSGTGSVPGGLLKTGNGIPVRAAPGTLATLNWEDVVDTEEQVDNEWIPEMGRCWVMGNSAYKQHLVTLKGGAASSTFLLEKGMPMMGYDAIKSSFLTEKATINTSGRSGEDASNFPTGKVVFGNFMDQFVGFWDGFETVVEGITNPAVVKITVMVMWDTITTRDKSFVQSDYT